MGMMSIYPTGVTLYNPEKTYNGYTLLPLTGVGVALINMNGDIVKLWKDMTGFPPKLLPDGNLLAAYGFRDSEFGYQDVEELVQLDWDGKEVWLFNQKEHVCDNGNARWIARQHHDFQREGNPVGYYVPGMQAKTTEGHTLILCHEDLHKPRISDKRLLDDVIIEVDWDGNILWKWNASNHFAEMGFSEIAKNALFRNPNRHENAGGQYDWVHINSMSELGPNHWFDEGDTRFAPDNIIWDAREANILAIIEKQSGKIVWKLGPDFTETEESRRIRQIIGQHHCHMIPKGLPGEGNILLFDNGGWAGYGLPSRTSKDGTKSDIRDHSRVLELNPVTLEIVWEFDGTVFGGMNGMVAKSKFYSPLISSAQRLPNGNTLITEGCYGRLLEVTAEKEIVWEFVNPFSNDEKIYRAYRYPYEYVPQLEKPVEYAVEKIDNKQFRVPGSGPCNIYGVTTVAGAHAVQAKVDSCVTDDQSN